MKVKKVAVVMLAVLLGYACTAVCTHGNWYNVGYAEEATKQEEDLQAALSEGMPADTDDGQQGEQSVRVSDVPVLEQATLTSSYVVIKSGTMLYTDRECTKEYGTLAKDHIMLAQEVSRKDEKKLYEAFFDTQRSQQRSRCERAYFYADALESPSFIALQRCITSRKSGHNVQGQKVLLAEIDLVQEGTLRDRPYINKNNISLREEPSKASPRVAVLAKHTPVEIEAEVKGDNGKKWYRVQCDDLSGYVRTRFVHNPNADTKKSTSAVNTPAQAQTEMPEPTLHSVSIETSYDTDEPKFGSTVTLTAHLTGYEGEDYTCCWQCAAVDSKGNIVGKWQNAQEDVQSVCYTLTRENVATAWRVRVITHEQGEALYRAMN